MSSDGLHNLSDQIGDLTPNPADNHIALLLALKSAKNADDQRTLLEHLFKDGPR